MDERQIFFVQDEPICIPCSHNYSEEEQLEKLGLEAQEKQESSEEKQNKVHCDICCKEHAKEKSMVMITVEDVLSVFSQLDLKDQVVILGHSEFEPVDLVTEVNKLTANTVHTLVAESCLKD